MANLELLLEAEKRGILPENKKMLLSEARNRGIIAKAEQPKVNPNIQWSDPSPIEKPTEESINIQMVKGGIKETGKQLLQATEPAIESLGMIGGELLGATAGQKVLGGAGGYTAAKEAIRGTKELFGVEKPLSAKDTLLRQAETFKQGVQMEMLGGLIGKTIQGLGKGISLVTGKAREVLPQYAGKLNIAKKLGYKPSIGELTEGTMEENLLKRTTANPSILKNANERLNQQMTIRENLINKNASEESIQAVTNKIKTESKNLLEKVLPEGQEILDSQVDDFVKAYANKGRYKTGITMQGLLKEDLGKRQAAINTLEEEIKTMLPFKGKTTIGVSDTAKEIVESYFPAKDKLAKKAYEETGKISWEILDEVKKNLGNLSRDAYNAENFQMARTLRENLNIIDDEMQNYLTRIDRSDIQQTFKIARGMTKQKYDLYENIGKVLDMPPEDILNKIVNKGEITLVQDINNALGEKGLIPLRKGMVDKLVSLSTKEGKLDPTQLNKLLTDKNWQDTFTALKSEKYIEPLKEIADRGIYLNSKIGNMKIIDFVKDLSKVDENNIGNFFLKPENTKNIIALKRLNKIGVFSDESVTGIYKNILDREILIRNPDTGLYMPQTGSQNFNKNISKLKQLLPNDLFNGVKEFVSLGENANVLENIAKGAKENPQLLPMMERVMGGSIAGGALLGGARATAVATYALGALAGEVTVPYLLAKAYNNPLAMRYYTTAAKLPVGSQEAIDAFTKALLITLEPKEPNERKLQ